jgi:hypothetical protein
MPRGAAQILRLQICSGPLAKYAVKFLPEIEDEDEIENEHDISLCATRQTPNAERRTPNAPPYLRNTVLKRPQTPTLKAASESPAIRPPPTREVVLISEGKPSSADFALRDFANTS